MRPGWGGSLTSRHANPQAQAIARVLPDAKFAALRARAASLPLCNQEVMAYLLEFELGR